MKIGKGSKLLFIGDSITDCGRARPVGTAADGLGSGYVSLVHTMMGAHCPELDIEIVNTGIGGNRVTDLDSRWEQDVVALRPDWLSIKIGINDVWRQFDSAGNVDQVSPEMFRDIYARLIETTQPSLKGLILITPYYIEPDNSDPMRSMMNQYGDIVKELASKYSTILADSQAGFDRYLKYKSSNTLCGDKVHPNSVGHMIIARSFLDAIDFKW